MTEELKELAFNAWSQKYSYLIKKKSDEKSILKAIELICENKIDLMSNIKSRKPEFVCARRLYMFIMYLHFGVKVQIVADKFGMTRANIYHHCHYIFDQYDVDMEFRIKMSMFFTKDYMIELRERLSKVERKRK